MPVPRAAAAERCRIPLGLRPGTFSFRFQGGPSSYEKPQELWAQGRNGPRCGGTGGVGEGLQGGGLRPLSALLCLQRVRRFPPAWPAFRVSWSAGLQGRTEAPPCLPALDTPPVGGAKRRCP